MIRTLEHVTDGELLTFALMGLERRADETRAKIAELRETLGLTAPGKPVTLGKIANGKAPKPAKEPAKEPAATAKRTMSDEGRKRVQAAQKKRWAKVRRAAKAVKAAAKLVADQNAAPALAE